MSALIKHVALVSETPTVQLADVMKVAAALQKQALRDFKRIWKVAATVDPFARLEDVPLGYWPIIILDDIGNPSAAGFHTSRDGQPFRPGNTVGAHRSVGRPTRHCAARDVLRALQ